MSSISSAAQNILNKPETQTKIFGWMKEGKAETIAAFASTLKVSPDVVLDAGRQAAPPTVDTFTPVSTSATDLRPTVDLQGAGAQQAPQQQGPIVAPNTPAKGGVSAIDPKKASAGDVALMALYNSVEGLLAPKVDDQGNPISPEQQQALVNQTLQVAGSTIVDQSTGLGKMLAGLYTLANDGKPMPHELTLSQAIGEAFKLPAHFFQENPAVTSFLALGINELGVGFKATVGNPNSGLSAKLDVPPQVLHNLHALVTDVNYRTSLSPTTQAGANVKFAPFDLSKGISEVGGFVNHQSTQPTAEGGTQQTDANFRFSFQPAPGTLSASGQVGQTTRNPGQLSMWNLVAGAIVGPEGAAKINAGYLNLARQQTQGSNGTTASTDLFTLGGQYGHAPSQQGQQGVTPASTTLNLSLNSQHQTITSGPEGTAVSENGLGASLDAQQLEVEQQRSTMLKLMLGGRLSQALYPSGQPAPNMLGNPVDPNQPQPVSSSGLSLSGQVGAISMSDSSGASAIYPAALLELAFKQPGTTFNLKGELGPRQQGDGTATGGSLSLGLTQFLSPTTSVSTSLTADTDKGLFGDLYLQTPLVGNSAVTGNGLDLKLGTDFNFDTGSFNPSLGVFGTFRF